MGHSSSPVPISLLAMGRLRPGPLSIGALHRVVNRRLGAPLSRPKLVRLHATASEIDEAVEHGVLVLVEGQVRFSHPLLASTVYGDAGEFLRIRVHQQLAQLAESPEERARHLALAGTGPDEEVAAELEAAAETACRRGAHGAGAGAGLYEKAASLTPSAQDGAQAHRLISAAAAHFRAGEPSRVRELLDAVAAREDPIRFEALCRLGAPRRDRWRGRINTGVRAGARD